MSAITFDFNTAVEEVKSLYPHETRKTVFIDMGQENAFENIRKWGRKNYFPFGYSKKETETDLKRSSFARPRTRMPLICIHTTEDQQSFFTKKNLAKENLFVLYHETAHVVIPSAGGLANKAGVVYQECAADLFASIHGLRHGWMTKEDILHVSTMRSAFAIAKDTSHITTRALDWLVRNADKYDWQAMTPEDIKTFTETHAEQFRPGDREMDAVNTVFEAVNEEWISLSSSVNKSRIDETEKLYDMIVEAHATAPAQSLLHKTTERILIAALDRKLTKPAFPPTRDKETVLAQIFNRLVEKPLPPPPPKPKNWFQRTFGF